MALLRFSLHV